MEASDAEAGATLVFQCISGLKHKLQTMWNDINQTSIRSINQAAFVNLESMIVLIELSLGVAVNCDQTEQIIGSFTDKLDEQTLDDLMQITQDVLQRYGKNDGDTTDNTFTVDNSLGLDNTLPHG